MITDCWEEKELDEDDECDGGFFGTVHICSGEQGHDEDHRCEKCGVTW